MGSITAGSLGDVSADSPGPGSSSGLPGRPGCCGWLGFLANHGCRGFTQQISSCSAHHHSNQALAIHSTAFCQAQLNTNRNRSPIDLSPWLAEAPQHTGACPLQHVVYLSRAKGCIHVCEIAHRSDKIHGTLTAHSRHTHGTLTAHYTAHWKLW